MSDRADPGPVDEQAVLAVPISATICDRIDEEIERKQERTGDDHTRQQFVRFATIELLERLDGQRWQEEHGHDD